MSSLLTNTSAMIALQTLRTINSDLSGTSERISTGLRINSAKDSAAYWSIATTTRSDRSSLSAVQDSLGLGAATVDVVDTGLGDVYGLLETMRDLLVTAVQPTVDRTKIQEEIAGIQDDILNKATSAVINGQNWLSVDSGAVDYNATKSFNSSFSRVGGTVTIDTIDLDISAIKLYDATGVDGVIDLDRTSGGSTISLANIDISALTDASADITTLNEYVSIVDAAMQDLATAQVSVGIASSRIDSQREFVKALIDANDRAIGTLVDADMEEESTRLAALQTQQQLGIQALAIANSNSQNILALFR